MRTAAKLGGLLAVVVVPAWLTYEAMTPDYIRLFDRLQPELVAHAEAVRAGTIAAADDPNRIVRYPVAGKLRRNGLVCLRRGDVLVYYTPTLDGLFDNGSAHSRCYVTSFDGKTPAAELPNRLGTAFLKYEVLALGRWAYWHGG